jgi:transcriptional regulator with XRE-family HTH domain
MRLKDIREDRDLTQREVAEHLHIRQNTYSQYENGQRGLPIDTLIKLARYFGVSTDYILELTDEEAAAIRWHMGAYGDPDKLQTVGQAFDRWPLALFLHLADMICAHYIEKED